MSGGGRLGLRATTLTDLCAELMGPRNGPFEVMADDPRTEYVTGVLRPEPLGDVLLQSDVDGEAPELLGAEAFRDEDAEDAGFVGTIPPSPSIDPRQPSRSLGLSFVLAGDSPTFRVCATWARYIVDPAGWRRTPDLILTPMLEATSTLRVFDRDGVELRVETSALRSGGRRVSVWLLNVRRETDLGRRGPSEHVFQPQLRVALDESATLIPMHGAARPAATEESELDLLYARREAFARGHMCGATWRAIDPERDAAEFEAERPSAAPFTFTDAHLLSPVDVTAFSPPDLRTDYLPLYAVKAPETAWSGAGDAPTLAADELAATWDPEAVVAALSPLARGYRTWVAGLESRVAYLPDQHRAAGRAAVRLCRALADRLDDAVHLLQEDEDVRLAFCFANRAMAIQGLWSRGAPLVWRPFQLAFLLVTLRSAADPGDPGRGVCDLLWFPTGGGKTEAYLALAAFTLGRRRLRSPSGAGVGVISRYTLRLLTIQQFRRALATITACELLRVDGLSDPAGLVGWRPTGCSRDGTFIWGGERFSAGLWVGNNVTPNRMDTISARPDNRLEIYLGAVDILKGARFGYQGPDQQLTRLVRSGRLHQGGEPAQVVACPCCRAVLAVPHAAGSGGGLGPGEHVIHVPHAAAGTHVDVARVAAPEAGVELVSASTRPLLDAFATELFFRVRDGASLTGERLDDWWHASLAPELRPGELLCVRPARPGYALVRKSGPSSAVTGFEVLCPAPGCELNRNAWAENVPVLRSAGRVAPVADRSFQSASHAHLPSLAGHWQDPPLVHGRLSARTFGRVPIPACTVDEQIYARCPSLLVATADKFARLAFEPRASSIFGNVERYHAIEGFYRRGGWQPDQPPTYRPDPPGGPGGHAALHVNVPAFDPPDLIIQDELHLIEGPLGSMVGIYETAVAALGAGAANRRAKYVASTATVRQAGSQVRALFDRDVAQFPPSGLDADDSFFARTTEPHPLDELGAGRLYVGVAAPGKGAQTPIVRIWSSLLQSGLSSRGAPPSEDPDRLWTLAGYFNAVRELSGAATLYRQDIPDRMKFRFLAQARSTEPEGYMELSSRVDSVELPGMLDALGIQFGVDVVCATSMFGTGVDVDRLGLMVVHGQPKTTSSYIQATGRVGRRSGGLVVSFMRASRPRDLDHYEFFCGYHRALYRHVEAITVSPFAPKARDRCLGPLSVALLRQAASLDGSPVHADWRVEQRLSGQRVHSEANRMASHRRDAEVTALPALLERRSQTQPTEVRPSSGETALEATAELDRWQMLARRAATRNDLVYYEPAMVRTPVREVVLGDPQHAGAGLGQAFENAPQSLRAIEETTTFKI
ncbi:DISARM system helicase DrmA [Methylorubrum thiocyanatum]|uniref:DISARM system helicase DrmA n=1 Tax=Methylorubrum thiocyanatum TaxID=47958 RepID=UPI003657E6A3